MTQHRQQIINAIYDAFRTVPRPPAIDGCAHCIEMGGIQVLLNSYHKKSLRELTNDELRLYAFKAMTTIGCAADFQYFLPRLLELAFEGTLGIEPEILGDKLFMAGFESWSEDRRHAIFDGIDLTFNEVLQTDFHGSGVDSWLCVLGRMRVDLTDYLDRILHSGAVLIGFYEWHAPALNKGRLSGFWDTAPKARQQVIDWFESENTKTAINQQYLETWTAPNDKT
jgi:hypothetical protein